MKPQKNSLPERASRQFTDREEPRKAFWAKYEKLSAEMAANDPDVHVLMYYGFGGIGKTRLLKELAREMEEKGVRYGLFDLEISRDPIKVLNGLKAVLAKRYHFTFPLFEYGQYIYAKKLGEDANDPQAAAHFEKNGVVSIVKKALEFVPVVSEAVKLVDLAEESVASIRSFAAKNTEKFKMLDFYSAKELNDKLPGLFAQDLQNNVSKLNEPVVILLDTYELLVNELAQNGEPLFNDLWLREELVAQASNVLWVFGGRECLKWETVDPKWQDVAEQHILGDLSESDSVGFLRSTGILDQTLCEKLYVLTNGTPLYLDLCVDTYFQLQSNGKQPDIGDFGQNTAELIERFIRYMDSAAQALVFTLACLKRWNDALIEAVAYEILPNFNDILYTKAKNLSFVICENGEYYIHQTVSEVLLQKCTQGIKSKVAQGLKKAFEAKMQTKEYFAPDYEDALGYMLRAARLDAPTEAALYESLSKTFWLYLYEYASAGFFRQAEAALDFLDVREAGQKTLTVACVKCVKATVATCAGEYKAACEMEKTALDMFKALLGEDHPDTLVTMRNLAGSLSNAGKYQESLELKQEVLAKQRKILGDDHPDTLVSMHNLAVSYSHLGKHREALELKQEVLAKQRKIQGENHPDTILTMHNLAVSYSHLGKHREALELAQEVLEKRHKILGKDHPDTVGTMHNISVFLSALGRNQEALELDQEVLKTRRNILGDDHPDTVATMHNLAILLSALGRYQEAQELQQEVLTKQRKISH